MRITVKDLREAVSAMNDDLQARGERKRFVEQGRNGYQAVDVFSVDENGDRIGTGVDYNVGCGSSRECIQYMREEYYRILSRS